MAPTITASTATSENIPFEGLSNRLVLLGFKGTNFIKISRADFESGGDVDNDGTFVFN